MGAHRNMGFPFNISATAGANDFKFGAQLGFAKAHHKITCTIVEANYFQFGTRLGFAKSYHKTAPRGKVAIALG